MNDDDIPTSFDALAHEHNLSGRMRDLMRVPFREALFSASGQQRGRSLEQIVAEMNLSGKQLELARLFSAAAERIGRKRAEELKKKPRPYHPALDKDTAPGEFR